MTDLKRLICLATTVGESRLQSVQRMLESIPSGTDDSVIEVHCLLQDVSDDVAARLEGQFPYFRFHRSAHRLGLSAARNFLLREAAKDSPPTLGDVFCFPDDDCELSPTFFEAMLKFASVRSAAVRIHAYADWAGRLAPKYVDRESGILRTRGILEAACSITTAVNGPALLATACFDENLGVGTSIGSGEDVDFVLCARRAGALIDYENTVIAFHAISDTRADYLLGGLVVVLRYFEPWSLRSTVNLGRTLFGAIRRSPNWTDAFRMISAALRLSRQPRVEAS